MLSQLRTLWEVFKHLFSAAETVQYPEVMPYMAPRYRGRIILTRDPDGEERCVACNLCAVACPVARITAKQDSALIGNAAFFMIPPFFMVFTSLGPEFPF